MGETIGEKATSKNDPWRERIAEQERSGMSVKKFCKEQGFAEHQFYYWRKRLRRRQPPVRFALVDRGAAADGANAVLELVLLTGERLRIGSGVNATTLHTVLEALRA